MILQKEQESRGWVMIEDALVWLQQADPSAVYGFLF